MVRHYEGIFMSMSDNNVYRHDVFVETKCETPLLDTTIEAVRKAGEMAEHDGAIVLGVEYIRVLHHKEVSIYRVVYTHNTNSTRRTQTIEVHTLSHNPLSELREAVTVASAMCLSDEHISKISLLS